MKAREAQAAAATTAEVRDAAAKREETGAKKATANADKRRSSIEQVVSIDSTFMDRLLKFRYSTCDVHTLFEKHNVQMGQVLSVGNQFYVND